MHRQIDSYTDAHEKFREAKLPFRDEFGLYSGIIVDFLYDYFLASTWNVYSDLTLRTFSKQAHAVLLMNFMNLPARVQVFLPHLIQNRRLESYATVYGIIEAITIMGKYTSLPIKPDFIQQTLQTQYSFFAENFKIFMSDIILFVSEILGIEMRNKDV